MQKVQKPMLDVKKVFTECISNYKYENLLEGYIAKIVAETTQFQEKFLNETVHEITPKSIVFEELEKDKEKLFAKLYTDRFVKSTSPGRKYYNELMGLPKRGICPLCGVRDVGSLDHYMPKSKFPILAVSPINLVAACSVCNHTKSDDIFSRFEEATIHPYFDDIENEEWLKAELIDMEGPVFRYYVITSKPNGWSESLYLRVKKHFTIFELSSLFAKRAISEFEDRKFHFISIYEKGGREELISFFQDEIKSRSKGRGKNHWQIAMINALISSKWFFDEYILNSIKEENTCTK